MLSISIDAVPLLAYYIVASSTKCRVCDRRAIEAFSSDLAVASTPSPKVCVVTRKRLESIPADEHERNSTSR